jgi:hypothetical protein
MDLNIHPYEQSQQIHIVNRREKIDSTRVNRYENTYLSALFTVFEIEFKTRATDRYILSKRTQPDVGEA